MAIAAIVAGGKGTRMGGDIPKQFMELRGKPVIIYTIEQFLKHDEIENVIVGINPQWHEYTEELVGKFFSGGVHITDGGADRNDTIVNIITYAKEKLSASEDEILLTHDAVRPFVTEKMISDSIAAMEDCDICTTAITATDTMLISSDGITADEFPLRSTMFRVQTPQTFRIGGFIEMLHRVPAEQRSGITDACRLYHINGKAVKLIEGAETNIKLTYPSDFTTAETLVKDFFA